jgi:RNA polymerase sigma-70 factor (ECF subfamily)
MSDHDHQMEFQKHALGHMDVLYRTALRLTRSRADAEDLVQETYFKAFRAWNRFELGTNLKAWLLTILTHTFFNDYRREERNRQFVEMIESRARDGILGAEVGSSVPPPPDESVSSSVGPALLHALDRLPDDYRAVLLLADVEELSYKEIAEAVQCPTGTVMSRLHRARRLMRKYLGEKAGVARRDVASESPSWSGSPAAISGLPAPVDLTHYRSTRAGRG